MAHRPPCYAEMTENEAIALLRAAQTAIETVARLHMDADEWAVYRLRELREQGEYATALIGRVHGRFTVKIRRGDGSVEEAPR